MMNPSSDVCKKCALQWAIFVPRYFVGLIHVLPLSIFYHISLDYSIHFCVGHVQMGTTQALLEQGDMHLCLCHVTQATAVSQHINNDYLCVEQVVSMVLVLTLSTFVQGSPIVVGYGSLIGIMPHLYSDRCLNYIMVMLCSLSYG